MSVVLIFPPTWDISFPYLSVPSLSAYLKDKGIPVKSIDANIESFHYLLKKENISEILNSIRTLNHISDKYDKKHEILVQKAEATGEYILQNIDKALAYFGDRENLDAYFDLVWANSIIEETMELYTARYYPVHFTMYGIINLVQEFNPDDIVRFSNSKDYPLKQYYEKILVPEVLSNKPSIVGFSVICRDQLLHSLYLAKMLKERDSGIHMTLGGCFGNVIADKIINDFSPLERYFDSIIFGQGEIPLYKLCRAIESNSKTAVSNVLFLRESNEDFNLCNLSGNYKDYPVPDFSDFPLKKYLAKDIMLPYQIASGCYYGKCAFCNSKSATTSDYVIRKASRVYEDLKTLKEKYDCSIFHINDEALNIGLVSGIADKLSELDLSVFTEARFEKSLDLKKLKILRKAGIKKIAFGFESANKRILGLMDKGYDIDDAKEILENCYKADIEVHLFGIIAFPGETEEERMDTLNFVKSLTSFRKSLLFGYFFHTFLLEYNCRVYKNPEIYGIAEIIDKEKFNFYADYRIKGNDRIIDNSTYLDIRDEFHKEIYTSKPRTLKLPYFCDLVYMHYFDKKEIEDIALSSRMPAKKMFILYNKKPENETAALFYVFDIQYRKFYSIDALMNLIFKKMTEYDTFNIGRISEIIAVPKAFIRSKAKEFGFEYIFE